MMLLDDGRLGLIDFGLVAQMTPIHQESMASAILCLVAGDYGSLEQCFVGMGILDAEVGDLRRPGTEQPFAEALQEALTGTPAQARRVQGSELDRRRAFGQLYEELSGLAFRYYFTLPSYYVLVMRSFVTLEGIAFGADPDFNMYTSSYPFALRRMMTPRTSAGRQLLRRALFDGATGRLRVLSLLRDRGQTAEHQDSSAPVATTAMRVASEVLCGREGRELRRVLREADSLRLIADLGCAAGAPLRRALSRALVRRAFRGRQGGAGGEGASAAAALERAKRRQRRHRRLLARIAVGHLRKARWQSVRLLGAFAADAARAFATNAAAVFLRR